MSYLGHRIDAKGLHPLPDKGPGNSGCSGSPECAGIEVIPGTVVLLWQVLVKPVVSASTPVSAAEKGLPVALVSSQESSFQVVQGTAYFVQVTRSL